MNQKETLDDLMRKTMGYGGRSQAITNFQENYFLTAQTVEKG